MQWPRVVIKLPNDKDPTVPATPIGFLRLVSPGKGLEHHQRAEFIISLRPAFHGKGFGTETVNWLVTIGFQRANLHRIGGSYNMGNIPAEKCYTKLWVNDVSCLSQCMLKVILIVVVSRLKVSGANTHGLMENGLTLSTCEFTAMIDWSDYIDLTWF